MHDYSVFRKSASQTGATLSDIRGRQGLNRSHCSHRVATTLEEVFEMPVHWLIS
jgi:hypothetical protein